MRKLVEHMWELEIEDNGLKDKLKWAEPNKTVESRYHHFKDGKTKNGNSILERICNYMISNIT